MGFRFERRIRLGKGSWINLSKHGASVSKRIGRMTVNSRGRGSIRLMRGLSYRFGRKHEPTERREGGTGGT